jgi:hypothetical protein
MRVRAGALALLLGAALSLSACGGGGGGDDSSEVSDTITTYLSAIASGDGDEACEQLTSSEAAKVFQEATSALPELRATGCADALTKLSESIGGERKVLESAEVTDVKIDGDTATAGVVGGSATADLTKVDGTWLISGGIGLGG